MLEVQREGTKMLEVQMEKFITVAQAQGEEQKRGNDLFERFLNRSH